MTLTYGSLFSGIDGIGLALESFGFKPAWQSEVDPHASTILAKHWPDVPNLGDITKIDWSEVEPVDVIAGGFPCQDISLAGKGAGIKDGTRSGLWSYFADALGVVRPRHALIENVSALAVRGLDRVLCDLAEIGFDAEWTCLRASDVGAPHRRERLFLLASDSEQLSRPEWWRPTPGQEEGRRSRCQSQGRSSSPAANTDNGAVDGERTRSEPGYRGQVDDAPSNSDSWRQQISSQPHRQSQEQEKHDESRHDSDGLGQVAWGDYELSIRRWASLTRHAPPPTDDRGRLSVAFVEWIMGFPEGWVDGIPRSGQLKCLGNAVVPAQALAAIKGLAV